MTNLSEMAELVLATREMRSGLAGTEGRDGIDALSWHRRSGPVDPVRRLGCRSRLPPGVG